MADADTTLGGSACPTGAELSSFGAGDLDTGSTEAIAAHLEFCLSCQQRLEQLDLSSASPHRREPKPVGLPFADESACERAVEAAVQRRDQSDRPATGTRPERMGEFELLEPLGAGGMGTVFKARHERLGTTSAVKLLHVNQQADERMIERFRREMVALGRLDHPNIVRALDAGDDAGVHYLVMEYVEGADLGAIVQRTGPLAIADACEAARQAALGLAYVHEHGRVHRDVKPSNVMVSSEGQVKLLDLGLARVDEYALDEPTGTTDDLLGAAPELTRTHQVMGTLEYMPPEQATSSKTVTEKADLYALGCTLYKLLTGHAPFGSGRSVTAMSQLMAHVQQPAPPIREARGDVPAELAELLERMLAKRPEDRPASAAEVAAGLAPFAKGSDLAALAVPAAASGRGSTGRTSPSTKRLSGQHRATAERRGLSRFQIGMLAAGLLLVLAIPVGLLAWLGLPTRTGTVIVEVDSAEAERLLQASNSGLFFVPESGSPGTRVPVRLGVQDLPPGKYIVEQAGPQDPRAAFAPAEFELARDQQIVVALRMLEAMADSSDPDAPPGEREPPSAAGPPVDLVAMVDRDRDIRGDDWMLVDGALVSQRNRPSAMHFPYRPPNHYRLEATVERVANNESLLLGLVAGGKPAYVAVDSHPYLGARTGMYLVDGVNITDRSGDIHRGQVLPPGQKVQLAAWVKHLDGQADIRLDADGREIFSWRGNVDQLGTGGTFRTNEPTALYLANWTAELRVSDMKLIPLDGEGEAIAFTDPAADPQRAAIERAIWKGARPRVRTGDGSPSTINSLADIRDGMQLVEVSFAGNDWVNDRDLLYFAALQTLEALDLSKTAISRDGLERLGPLPNLKRLSLSQLTGEGTLALAAELFPRLTTLNVSGNRLAGDSLLALEGLSELRELDLSHTTVTAAGLATLPELPNLRTLSLAGTQVDDLSAIGQENLPALTRLNVLGTAVTTDVSLPVSAAVVPQSRTSDEPVDLLELIDVERDSNAWETTWTREGDTIRAHPKSRLMLPVHLPQEFDLEMTARAIEANNSTLFGVALPDGTHFALGFDHSPHNGPTAILHWIDGNYQEQSDVKADLRTFPHDDSEPVSVRIAVRGQQGEIDIRAFKNGQEVLGWQGERSRLKVTNDWWLGVDPTRPWISQFDGKLEIQTLSVTPVKGEVRLPYSPEPTKLPAVVEVKPATVDVASLASGSAGSTVTSANNATGTVPADPIAQRLRQRIPGLWVLSGYGPVDVLPLIDVQRDNDGWGPAWQKQNNIIQVPRRSRLALPVTLPMEFDVEVTATRRSQGNAPVVMLPLPDGTRFAVGFDHYHPRGSYTILHGIDNAVELESPAKTQAITFPQELAAPVSVRISVRGTGDEIAIRVVQEGQEVLQWQGQRGRLSVPPDQWWSGADRTRPWVALHDGSFTIHDLTVTPYLGRIGLPDFGPSWGTPDRIAAQWVLDHGGRVHVQVDASDARRLAVQPGEALPKRPFWLTRVDDLAGAEIPTDWFQQVSRLQRLEELAVNQASFDNADLAPLAELKSLQAFIAFSSPVNDSGIASLISLPRLERIAIGNTAVTAAGLHGLAGHPALVEYAHSGARQADQVAAILGEVPNLEYVAFSESDLSGAGLEQLWGLSGLRRLYINNCRRLVDSDARQLLGLPNLRILDIRGCPFTGDALESIGLLKNLQTLRMGKQTIGDTGIRHLANLRQLAELDAWEIGLTDQAIPTIAGFPRLRLLKLGGNPDITDDSVPLLAKMDSLRELHITGTRISDQGLQQLQGALPNCRIHATGAAGVEELDLRGQVVTDESLQEILGGVAPKKLLLQGPEITDASIAYLASLPGLGELKLYGTSVTNDGLSPLAEAADLYRIELWQMPQIDGRALPNIARIPGLSGIVLKSTGVYGPGLELLHGRGINSVYTGHALLDGEMFEKYIVPFETLNGLDLAGSRISDEDVKLLSAKMTVSGYLHLGFNPNITGPGLQSIHDMPELRTLNLDGSGVDDDGLAHLQGAKHLQNLMLRRTAITDDSTDTLITLTGLRLLGLEKTGFTAAGVQRLRELMPEVKITADEVAP